MELTIIPAENGYVLKVDWGVTFGGSSEQQYVAKDTEELKQQLDIILKQHQDAVGRKRR